MGALQIIFDGEVASRVFDHLNISSISSTSSSERASASQQDLQNNNFLLQTFSKKIRAKEKVKHRAIFKSILNMALINSHTLKNKMPLVVRKRFYSFFQSEALKIYTKSMNISKKFCSPVFRGIRIFNLEQVAMYYHFI